MMSNRSPSVVMGGVQWGDGDGDRYPTLWVSEGGERFAFPLHRLVAYAHGKLDHPRFERDPREVHHRDGDRWNCDPDNLEALEPSHHTRVTEPWEGSQ